MEEILKPPVTQEGAGFESRLIRQFTVFVENRVGRLQTLVASLEDAKIVIRALAVQESADAALIRLICSDSDGARDALQAGKFSFGESELLAVGLGTQSEKPLSRICSALLSAEINIRAAYPFLLSSNRRAIALYVDDPTLSADILLRKGFDLLSESDLAGG